MSRRAFHLIVLTLSLFTCIYAQPELDISFNGTGLVTSSFGQGSGYMAAAVVQPDNKIVGIGRWMDSSFIIHIALIRYNEDGTVDTSFGSQGRVFQPIGVANAGAIQPDGRIIVVGAAPGTPGVGNILVARYNPDGSADTTFGNGGRTLYAFVQNANEARSVAVGPDGSIAVAASYRTTTDTQTVVVKLNSAGVVQWATADIRGSASNDQNLPTSIAFQADGKIVTSGCFLPGGSQAGPVTFARYNTDGSPDITFGVQGRLIFSSSSTEYIAAVAVQPDGRIVGAGHSGVNIMVMRMWGNGMLDISFSDDGRATASIPTSAHASSLVIRPNGKIVAAGTAGQSFAVAAFNTDGTLDTSFSGDGTLRFSFPEFPSGATSAALDHLGRIVLGGVANSRFAAARLYTLDPVPVTVTAQTVTAEGTPLRNIRVGLTGQDGQTRWAITSAFGFVVFDNVPTGQTYTLFVRGSKHYSFETRTLGLNEAVDNLALIGTPIQHRQGGDGRLNNEMRQIK